MPGVSLPYLGCVPCSNHVMSGSFLQNMISVGGTDLYMGLPHCDREARVVDVVDDRLWPLPRRPAAAPCCSSVELVAHHNLRQAFVLHAQYVPCERKSPLHHFRTQSSPARLGTTDHDL